MSDRTSFYRKISYAAVIVALCFVLGWLERRPRPRAPAGGWPSFATNISCRK